MIGKTQKMFIHIYKGAARMSEPTYRNMLRASAGVASSADPRMTQSGFDLLMAALEAFLFSRVHEGLVPDPIGSNKYIRSETHWRDKLPKAGYINSRQHHRIRMLWDHLKRYLPEAKHTDTYFGGIIAKCVGRSTQLYNLTNQEAGHVIDALRDRIGYAVRNQNKAQTPALLPY